MSAPKTTASGRLAFIDWTRGLAAVIMLQGHTFNSFLRTDLRPNGPYMLSQFVGGLPPAMFLFLTGITFAFLMDSQERQGVTTGRRIWAAVKRSRYLFILAFLFRIQLYVFGYPTSPASELLKVDILNCMGMAMLIFAPMAAFSTRERIRLCTILGFLVAALSPVLTLIDRGGLQPTLRAYLFPDLNSFGFFPWASFLAFGMVAGSVLRIVKPEDMQRTMLWTMGIGMGLAYVSQQLANLPYSIYPKVDFWLNSPALIMIKLGIVMCIMALAYLWVNLASAQRWSLFRQLGTTSLLVYWVHIELVYGRWFGIWKEGLTVAQVVIYTIVLLILMIGLSMLQTRYKTRGAFFRSPASARLPQPERASGD
jgi:uncharacterized membrane protein